MKNFKFKKSFMALVLAFSMICSIAPAVHAAEAAPAAANSFNYVTYFVVNCKQSITLRPGADVNSGEICQIPLGSAVSYIESAPNGFYKVVYNGTTGYALASYLSTTPPATVTYQPPQQVYTTYYVVNCKQSITLRPAPDVNSGEICQIPLGAAVSFVSAAGNGFYQIIYNGTIGYSLASYLSATPQTCYYDNNYYEPFYDIYYVVNCQQSITLRTSPSTSASEICQIPLGASVVFYSPAANGFYYVGYNGFTGYALASYLSSTPEHYDYCNYWDTYFVVNCNQSITLRTDPYTTASEICQIPLGAAVSFHETSLNGFYLVSYNQYTGYALASYLSPASGYSASETCIVVNCQKSITLRPGPYVESGEICQIPLGSSVTFVSDAGNGFYEIYYLGNHGYAMSSYLAFQ